MDREEERRRREDYAAKLFSAYRFEWRGDFENASVNALHADAFGHEPFDDDWEGRVREHSLGWVCARDDGLVGFVNVVWTARSTPLSWTPWSARGHNAERSVRSWSP